MQQVSYGPLIMNIMSCYTGFFNVRRVAISSAGRVGCEFIHPHNRRTPLQAEEALGPISIPQGSRGVRSTGTFDSPATKIFFTINIITQYQCVHTEKSHVTCKNVYVFKLSLGVNEQMIESSNPDI